MAQEMSFAQALNDAKGVILQLSNRVKTDAEKIRTQQQTIVSQSSSITQFEQRVAQLEAAVAAKDAEVGALQTKVREADTAREVAEAMINRQGERILALEAATADLQERLSEHKAQIVQVSAERDRLMQAVPSQEDSDALASMAALLSKAAPVLEKSKRTGMRIAGSEDVAEAA